LTIVVLTNLLIGAIMAFQGAIQLQRFGATSMTPIMVTVAHLRELGPIMTAFIVAGRSGAGMAAEIGTMQVSEEVDALKTMGLDPMRWLVLPRVVALLIALPLLTVVGNALGLFGGLIATLLMSDSMTWGIYWETVGGAMEFRHLGRGLFKTLFFGLAIAGLACAQGLAARGGAAAVGVRTTAAVVLSLFAVVVLDCLFAVIFAWLGW
jgi:phospholipid/cholesterol/gamma-HCH transport system permease protein